MAERARGPLEIIFIQLDFKPMVFGSFAEMSSNVKDFVEMAVEYGVEHLDMSMAASTPDGLMVALRRRYIAQLYLTAWRGYSNLVMDRTKYVGTGRAVTNRAKIRQDMIGRADTCEHVGLWTAHETNVLRTYELVNFFVLSYTPYFYIVE
jgi:hypothetical protein